MPPSYTTLITLADYQRIVLALIGEANSDASGLFTTADITNALNWAWSEALLEINHDAFYVSRVRDMAAGNLTMPGDADGGPVLGNYTVVYRKTSTDYKGLGLRTAESLDLNDPNWRNRTAVDPTEYVPQIANDGTETILLSPQPTATVTDGLYERWMPRPVEMVGSTDTSPCGKIFTHRQQRLLPYGAMKTLFPFDASQEMQVSQDYAALFAKEIMGCRSDLALRWQSGQGLSRINEGVGLYS